MTARLVEQTVEGAMELDAEAVAPGLFIHKSVTEYGRIHDTAYTVSHLTGYALGNNYPRVEALAAADRLAEIGDWNWLDMADKPPAITLESVERARDRTL